MKYVQVPLRLFAVIPLPFAMASCVPLHADAVHAPVAFADQPSPSPYAPDPAAQERISRRVAQLLAPVSNRPAAPFVDQAQSADDRTRSLDCLTSAIYYEARSEPEEGQRAVAQVVLNRVRHPAFPATVCEVVFQGSQRRTGCQFSFTCDGSLLRGRRQAGAWERARRYAAEALSGAVLPLVGNATHYHTTAILPYWAKHLRKSAIVGAHIFYRWAGSAGEASAFRQRYGGLEPGATFAAATESTNVTVHRGATSVLREDVTMPGGGGKVTIHRGVGAAAVAATAIEKPEVDGGIRVHSGLPPELG